MPPIVNIIGYCALAMWHAERKIQVPTYIYCKKQYILQRNLHQLKVIPIFNVFEKS